MEVLFSPEVERPLETGGGIKRARNLLGRDAPVLVHNGDVYVAAGLGPLLAAHAASGAAATVLTVAPDDPRALLFDTADRLVGWMDRTTGALQDARPSGERGGPWPTLRVCGYACVQVLSPRLLAVMDHQDEVFSVRDTWLEAARRGLRVQRFDSVGLLDDVGTVERLEALRRWLAAAR